MNNSEAVKHDTDKVRYDLIPAVELEALAKVLTFGSTKYGPNNWQQADGEFVQRVFAANMRHQEAIRKGELFDEETGLPHASHMMCNSMFLAWYANNKPWLFGVEPAVVSTANYAGSQPADHSNTQIVPWQQFDNWVTELIRVLQDQFADRFDCVVYVPRGGKTPGNKIARKLGLPCYSAKDDRWKMLNYKHILVVDDINDTGSTLWQLMEEKHDDWNITFATVVKRHSSTCDFAWFGHLETSNDYLIFPWEATDGLENN